MRLRMHGRKRCDESWGEKAKTSVAEAGLEGNERAGRAGRCAHALLPCLP